MDPNIMAESLGGRMIQPQPVDPLGDLKGLAQFIKQTQTQGRQYGQQLGQQVHANREAGIPYPQAPDFVRQALMWLEQKGIPATQENLQAAVQMLSANPAGVDMAAAPPDPSLGPPQTMLTGGPPPAAVAPIPPMNGDPALPQNRQPMGGDPMLPQFGGRR